MLSLTEVLRLAFKSSIFFEIKDSEFSLILQSGSNTKKLISDTVFEFILFNSFNL